MTVSRERARAGAVVLIACAQYVVAEAIAAAAWHNPTYSYVQNYISDLGVPGCGATPGGSPVCSPLAGVMNTGFILAGVLCLLATALLAPLIRGAVWRWLLIALAAIHGLGSILVGLVHSAPGSVAGSPPLHIVGAYMAVLGGNWALIVAGFGLRRAGAPLSLTVFSIAVGACGLASGLALVAFPALPTGLVERMAVDTVTLWECVTGIVLLVALQHYGRVQKQVAISNLRA